MTEAEHDSDAGGVSSTNTNTVTVNAASLATAEPSKSLHKGVVLGKDGKPCRSCSSKSAFSSWAAQTNASLKRGPPKLSPSANDCPPDVEALGRSTWALLHSIAATYPENPSHTQKEDLRGFMKLFSRLYPCWTCAEDFQSYMQKERLRVENRNEFGNWLCEAHNEVNRKLGKKEFNCSRWEERWRTGWKDGRCD